MRKEVFAASDGAEYTALIQREKQPCQLMRSKQRFAATTFYKVYYGEVYIGFIVCECGMASPFSPNGDEFVFNKIGVKNSEAFYKIRGAAGRLLQEFLHQN